MQDDKEEKEYYTHIGSKPARYRCDRCLKEFSRKSSVIRHCAIHQLPQHRCIHCSQAFHDRDVLRKHQFNKHQKHHHQTQQELREQKTTHECRRCARKFISASYLKQHLQRMHALEPSEQQRIAEIDLLQQEKKEHRLSVKSFPCIICYANFPTAYRLKRHNKVHTTEKQEKPKERCENNECNCQKLFTNINYLKSHLHHFNCAKEKRDTETNQDTEDIDRDQKDEDDNHDPLPSPPPANISQTIGLKSILMTSANLDD